MVFYNLRGVSGRERISSDVNTILANLLYYSSNLTVLRPIGLLSLLNSWMTTQEQSGDMFEYMATTGAHCLGAGRIFFPLHEILRNCYVDQKV